MSSSDNQAIYVDLSNDHIIKVSGEDAETFMQGQLTNDIRNVDGTHHQLSAHCSPKGRILFMMRIFARDGEYYLVMAKELVEAALKRLKMFVLMSKVTIEDVTDQWKHIGLIGNEALASSVQPDTNHDGTVHEENTTVLTLSDSRFELFIKADATDSVMQSISEKASEASIEDWTRLNIEEGIPSLTTETVEAFVPQMLNLQAINGVSFTKGCYTGQEVVARMQYLGKLKRRMYHCHIDSDTAPKAGDEIESTESTSGQGAGKVVSVASSANGGYELLAVIENNSVEAGGVSINGTPLTIKELPYSLETD